MTTLLENIITELNAYKGASKWARGVNDYALELIENLQENENYTKQPYTTAAAILADIKNGAENWKMYSYGGCSLIYDGDICERLATASFSKKKDGGRLQPSSRHTWLDCQAAALHQAANKIINIAKRLERGR